MAKVDPCPVLGPHRVGLPVSITSRFPGLASLLVPLTPEQEWLLSSDAESHLDFAARELTAQTNLLKLVQRLRKELTPSQAAQVLELAQLRLRAVEKFPSARNMFFTTRGYEQSSSERLAIFKSSQLPDGSRILDLCCGIGGDLSGFSRSHDAEGVDLDPLLCAYAQRNANLMAERAGQAVTMPIVRCQDALSSSWTGFDLVHIDPDRRVEHRTTSPRFIQPSLDQILEKAGDLPLAIKLAPATKLPDHLKASVHRQWLGERRECKQQMIWVRAGNLPFGRKSATLVLDNGTSVSIGQSTIASRNAPLHCRQRTDLGAYLYEPHSVVLAARLVDSLAAEHDLFRVADGIAYLTGAALIASPLLAGFRILATLPAEVRQVTAELKRLDAGPMEWKKRGVDLDLYENFRRIRTKGSKPLVAILTPLAGQFTCLLAERI